MGLQHLTTSMMRQDAFVTSSAYGAGTAGAGIAYDWRRLHAAAIDTRPQARGRGSRTATPAERISKRLFDVVAASLLLALFSPLFLVIALFACRDGGPVVFGHRRIGAYGQTFRCWKFRTMVPDAEKVLQDLLIRDPEARAEWEKDFKLKNDPRITPVGKFLRATSLDELPQLFNVLSGEMSLIGPRPIVAGEVHRYGASFHDYARCRPGITGIWQISGRNDISYLQRVELDRDYAIRWTFWLDLAILFKTPLAVLRRSGAY